MTILTSRWAVTALLAGVLAGPAFSARADDAVGKKPPTDLHGDPLPEGAVARLGTARLRHGDPVSFVAYIPGGKTVLSAGYDWTIRVWDLATGKELRRLTHAESAEARRVSARRPGRSSPLMADLSADGKVLATCAYNGRDVILWDVESGKEQARFTVPDNVALSLSLSPDGSRVAVGSSDSSVRILDAKDGKELRVLGKEPARAGGAVIFAGGGGGARFSPDGKMLVVISRHIDNGRVIRALRAFDPSGGKELYQAEGDNQSSLYGTAPAFSPDGKIVAYGTYQGDLVLLSAADGKELRKIRTNMGRTEGLTFSPDGKTILATALTDSSIGIWDVESGKELKKIGKPVSTLRVRTYSTYGLSGTLAVSADGKAAVKAEGNLVRLVDLETGKDLLASGGHHAPINGVHYLPDGKTVVTRGQDGTIRRWDPATGRETGQVKTPDSAYAFVLSPDAKRMVVEGTDGICRVFDAATGKQQVQLAIQQQTRLNSYAFSPDGKYLAVRSRMQPVTEIFSLETGKVVATPGKPAEVGGAPGFRLSIRTVGMAFSPDGRLLASPGTEGGVILWDVAEGMVRREIALPQETQVRGVAFSPDGRTVALDLSDNRVVVYELATGTMRATYRRKNEPKDPAADINQVVRSYNLNQQGGGVTLAFSPDGRRVALACDNREVRVWDVLTGEEVGWLRGHQADVAALAFSPDGSRLVSAGDDALALVWDVASLGGGKKVPASLAEPALSRLWSDLQEGEGGRAFSAIGTLVGSPAQAIPFLDRTLEPRQPPESGTIDQLIVDLDDRRFPTRRQALEELEQLGAMAVPHLEKVLKGNPSEEIRKRATELIEKARHQTYSPAQLQTVRAIEVLERTGTEAARAVLERLAKGPEGALETLEARAALSRMQ